jgi:transcriptional regulator with XRE-family HTH domain
MFDLTEEEQRAMERLALRFRALRVMHEPQAEFAARVGVSRPTLSRMEQGDPTQAIGYWLRALRLLDRFDEFERLFGPPSSPSLFEQAEMEMKAAAGLSRKRARRRPPK